MKKSRQIFLNKQNQKIQHIFECLMQYRIFKRPQELQALKNYFFDLKNAAKTSGLDIFYEIGNKYEAYMKNIEDENEITDEIFSTLLKGLADTYQEIKDLTRMSELSQKEQNSIQNQREEYNNKACAENILVVDDDLVILKILNKGLKQKGYYVMTTSNSDEVSHVLENHKIDLILLDLMMPGKNGLEVLEQIRKEYVNIPVIFMTASELTTDKIKAYKLGVDDYITKPFGMDELVARVQCKLKRIHSYKRNRMIDPLTGAYEKIYLKERLNEQRELFIRNNHFFSIVFLDIDYFKKTNDTYGHLAGDYMLKKFTDFFKENLRSIDQIYRFGGDEFLIILPETKEEGAFKVMERLRTRLNQIKFQHCDMEEPVSISFSGGIAMIEDKNQTLEQLLKNADKALYYSKKMGRARNSLFKWLKELDG
ncbi:diguanylate cyclase [Lutibacter sp. B2]|nr:diguanylate cyclase [Lutibacter sp. B2]